MFGSRPAALSAALDTATMVLPAWPSSAPADSRPAGTMAQLAGQGAWLVATPKRRVFPGRPEQVAQARRFVARMLDGCPVADDAQLCASELASNAIRHTRTGRRSGKFQVVVWRGRASVCVAVLDDGSDSTSAPAAGTAGMLAESGHGLLTVQTLAAWWGHHRYRDGSARGTAVWFRLDWNPARSP
jgi:anti-sigma regulatory factor (Ser/Thr protein kinase)